MVPLCSNRFTRNSGNKYFKALFAISDPGLKGYQKEFTKKYSVASWSFSRMMKHKFSRGKIQEIYIYIYIYIYLAMSHPCKQSAFLVL